MKMETRWQIQSYGGYTDLGFIIIVIIILLFMNTRVKVIFDQGYLSVYIFSIVDIYCGKRPVYCSASVVL